MTEETKKKIDYLKITRIGLFILSIISICILGIRGNKLKSELKELKTSSAKEITELKQLISNKSYAVPIKSVTTIRGVSMRQSPKGKLITTVPAEKELIIIGCNIDWYKVQYKDNIGYIYSEYLKINK